MKNLILAGRTPTVTYSSHSHFHSAWEFIYYVNGTGRLFHDDSFSRFSPGDIAIVPPHMPHHEEIENGYETFIILFNHSNSEPNTVRFYHDAERQLFSLVEMLHSQFYTVQPNRMNICEATLHLIEQYIVSYDMQKVERKHSRIVSSFINVLIEHFTSPDFQLKDAMRDIPYSDDYFRKLFKKETGKSPLKYLSDLRIEYARQFLEESTLSVKRIAYLSGFSDPYYFSRQFKCSCGKYPSEWRKHILEKREYSFLPDMSDEYVMRNFYDKCTVWKTDDSFMSIEQREEPAFAAR